MDSGTEIDKEYNPISKTLLKRLGFDYVALGHIHKASYNEEENQNIIYPGSLISLGFDELGEHGMIEGNFENNALKVDFIKLDDREFVELQKNVQVFNSQEDLIENINEMNLNENFLYKIILMVKRNFDIDSREVLKLISKENILKVKDLTELDYDLEEISKENTLRGIFVKEALEKMEIGEFSKEEIEKAIEIGLKAL